METRSVDSITVAAGGWSLPSDIKKCPKDFIIAANYHAALMLDVDLVVHWGEYTPALLKYSDVNILDISDSSIRHIGLTGTICITLALLLKPKELWLAGYDLYTGPQPYYHNYSDDPLAIQEPLECRIRRWRRYFDEIVTRDELNIIKAFTPLKEIIEEIKNG